MEMYSHIPGANSQNRGVQLGRAPVTPVVKTPPELSYLLGFARNPWKTLWLHSHLLPVYVSPLIVRTVVILDLGPTLSSRTLM